MSSYHFVKTNELLMLVSPYPCSSIALGQFLSVLQPLRAIRDAYPKAVIVMRGRYPTEVDGIKIVGAADFLLHRRGIA